MSIDYEERPSDSQFVRSVVRIGYAEHRADLSVPDGCWDFAIFRYRGRATVLLTGATTRPVTSVNRPGDELLCISFKPGVFMPSYSPMSMRDKAITLPIASRYSFGLGSEVLEIPTFENADDFVARLSRSGLLALDELVDSVVSGEPRAASIRSLQRHFLQATGLTLSFHRQIQRARRAVDLLRQGRAAVEVALEAGFADQSHMINSLKSITGRTPSQIVQMH